MIAVRALAFLLFLALALALGAWQVENLRADVARAPSQGAGVAILLLALAIPLCQAALYRLAPARARRVLLGLAGLPALPLMAAGAGLVSAIQARGADHRRVWDAALILAALAGANVALPIVAGYAAAGGGPGLALGWMAIKAQFYLAVDYFLARALVHYFNSGAGTFVSLRYLRKRVISLLSVVGIGAGVTVLILVNSVMTGFQTNFKEEVRGSLSHVLVRFDGERIQNAGDDSDFEQAQWQHYVGLLEQNPELAGPWNEALVAALARFRARGSDGDGLPDFVPRGAMQPADEEPDAAPRPANPREQALIEALRTGKGLRGSDRELLRDGQRVVSPREFYLERVPDPAMAEDAARRAWYGPVFRRRLQEQFDRAAAALATHRAPDGRNDIEGVSWRVGTKTFITPRTGSRELSLADIVGVDPARENEIANLGRYVAAAEVHVFKDQHVLKPIVNLLGATLGWETEQSLEELGVREPAFMYTPDGRQMGRLPADMKRTLQARDLVTGAGNVRWANFDRVRFAAYSPGQELYRILRQAHKDAQRSDDLDVLRAILNRCHAAVSAVIERHLAGPEPAEPALRAARTGCRIIRNDYLTAISQVDRAIRRNYEHIAPELKAFMDDAATPPRVPEETAALARLLERINAVTAAADKAAGEDAPSDGARQQALADMLSAYAATFDQAAARASAEGWGSRGALRQLAALVPKPEAGLVLTEALRDRRPVPLTFAVEQFDSGAEYARRRMEAYREVLPLRATMRPDDTVAVYRARALESGRRPGDGLADQGAEPGLILGDALAESAILGGVNVGDVVEVTIPRVYFVNGRPDSKATQIKFRITALFRSGLFEDNLGRMYCDFDVLTGVLADSQARYYVGARLRDYSVYEGAAAADSLKRSIQEALFRQGALASGVTLWEDEKRSLLEAVEREKMILGLIVSFIIVLAGVLILILVFQLVNEKQKDIGILKALGFSPWGIRSVFMFNALFIGLFGAILGALAGITLSEYLNEIEDFIDQWTGTRLFPPDVYFLTYIPSVKGTALVRLALDIAAPVVLFSFGCGILPAQLAARKDPVEALHYE